MFDEDELLGVDDSPDDADPVRRVELLPYAELPYVDGTAWTSPYPLTERTRVAFRARHELMKQRTAEADERWERCRAARFFCEALGALSGVS